ncbi:MAG: endonuclease/exonuclease/phosphatase family protein [Leptolyngbyaceae cyanobacterium]
MERFLTWANDLITQSLAPLAPYCPLQDVTHAHEQFSHGVIQSPAITVLNWNIAKNNHLPDCLDELALIFTTYQPDLVFLQELRLDQSSPLTLAGMGWHFVPNFMDLRSQHQFGVLTASRARHVRHLPLHSQHREPILDTPKVTLITEYALSWSHQTLLAANIHGINFVRTAKFQAQLEQLEMQLMHHDGPILLSGDFNTWNPKRMSCLLAMTQRLGLSAVEFAWDSHLQLKRFLLSDPLDHIFYRGMEPRSGSADVLINCEASDHKPMVVELQLKL